MGTYTRPGSTQIDYTDPTGDKIVGAVQKIDAAVTDIYSQVTIPTIPTGIVLETGAQTVATKTLTDVALTRVDKGTVSTGTVTFSLDDANVQRLQVGGSLTIATSNWATTGQHQELVIELVNGAAYTITWPTVNWIKSDGTTTTTFSSNGVTLQTSGTDWVILWSRDAGTTLYGKIVR